MFAERHIIFPPCRSWQVGEDANPSRDILIILSRKKCV